MEITNCRRILAIGPPECGLLELLKDLTGTTPTPNPDNTLAGLSHTWKMTTPYYSATIPIWLDEITSAPTWSSEFLKPEAREVLSVLGAFVVCFRKPVDRAQLERIKGLLEAVREVVREGCGFAWDGVCLAVGMRQSVTPYLEMSGEEWEDFCGDLGFEWVDFEAVGRNEFGESVGKMRLKEALEANDWAGEDVDGGDFDLDDLDGGDGEEGESTGFDVEATDLEEEMLGMRGAILGAGDEGSKAAKETEKETDEAKEDDDEQLEFMMQRLQAVRDMGADMPEKDRKKFAAKAVSDLLKKL